MNPVIASICSFTKSSIGRKMIVAITGLVLVLFLAGHLAGNLSYFFGPDAINIYAHKLHSMPAALLWAIRLSLLAFAGLHIYYTVKLTKENRAARQQYECKASIQSTRSSRTMIVSGLIILGFIVIHLLHFTIRKGEFFGIKYAELGTATIPGVDHPVYNVHEMMFQGFSNPIISAFYVIAMFCVCSHLGHGVQSIFQTVGLCSTKTKPFFKAISHLYAWAIFAGFCSLPVAIYVFKFKGFCCGGN